MLRGWCFGVDRVNSVAESRIRVQAVCGLAFNTATELTLPLIYLTSHNLRYLLDTECIPCDDVASNTQYPEILI
jgi:hypothetical protein